MRWPCSFHPRQGAGWAVWLRSSEGRVVRSGRCPSYVQSSNAAELSAIYAGVFLAVDAWGDRVGSVLVCADCQGALALAEPSLSPWPAMRRLQEKLRALLEGRGVALSLRWVRGHQAPSRSTQAYLNGRCDALARRGRLTGPTRASRGSPSSRGGAG